MSASLISISGCEWYRKVNESFILTFWSGHTTKRFSNVSSNFLSVPFSNNFPLFHSVLFSVIFSISSKFSLLFLFSSRFPLFDVIFKQLLGPRKRQRERVFLLFLDSYSFFLARLFQFWKKPIFFWKVTTLCTWIVVSMFTGHGQMHFSVFWQDFLGH